MRTPKLTWRWSKKQLLLVVVPIAAIVLLGSGTYAAIKLQAPAPAQHQALKKGLSVAAGEKGLIAWWKMDGNTKDASPYAKNGTATALTLTTDRKGKANSAYSFNGSTSVITSFPQVISPAGSRTVCTWFNTSSTSREGLVATRGASNNGFGFLVNRTAAGNLSYLHPGAGGTLEVAAGIATNAWYYACASYDLATTTAKIYLNGSQIASGAMPAELTPTTNGYIGYEGSSSNFAGSMGDVRIYNRALSASEIATQYAQYNSQLSLYKPAGGSGNGVNLTSGLVGWWPFNGNAKDATPYAKDGIATNATLTADRRGRASSAYSFNGTSTKISNFPQQISVLGARTVCTWFKTVSTARQGLVSTRPNTSSSNGRFGFDFHINDPSSGYIVYSHPSAGGVSLQAAAGITIGVWYFACVTYDVGTGTATIYLNGNSIGSGTVNAENATALTGVLGDEVQNQQNGGTLFPFSGEMDDVRIYNRVLSPSEVSALYNVYY
jgi:hypothetical protein